MNFKTTYVLFGLLLAMLATLFVVLWLGDRGSTNEGFVFTSFKDPKNPVKQQNITRVEIDRLRPAEDPLVFEKDGKEWKITQPRTLPAEGMRVDELIDSLARAKINEDTRSLSLKQAGLNSPSRVIKLTTDDYRELKLSIGEVTGGGGQAIAYVLSSDRPRPRPWR